MDAEIAKVLAALGGPGLVLAYLIYEISNRNKSSQPAPKAHEKLDAIRSDIEEIKTAIIAPQTGIRDRLTVLETKFEERTGK